MPSSPTARRVLAALAAVFAVLTVGAAPASAKAPLVPKPCLRGIAAINGLAFGSAAQDAHVACRPPSKTCPKTAGYCTATLDGSVAARGPNLVGFGFVDRKVYGDFLIGRENTGGGFAIVVPSLKSGECDPNPQVARCSQSLATTAVRPGDIAYGVCSARPGRLVDGFADALFGNDPAHLTITGCTFDLKPVGRCKGALINSHSPGTGHVCTRHPRKPRKPQKKPGTKAPKQPDPTDVTGTPDPATPPSSTPAPSPSTPTPTPSKPTTPVNVLVNPDGTCVGGTPDSPPPNCGALNVELVRRSQNTADGRELASGTGSVTVAPGATISCVYNGPCQTSYRGNYPIGTAVAVTATPGNALASAGSTEPDSVFAGFGGACSGSSCTVTITSQPQSVQAPFAPRTHFLTVEIRQPDAGLVNDSSTSSGIHCGHNGHIGENGSHEFTDCHEEVRAGQIYRLDATSNGASTSGDMTFPAWYFQDWDAGDACARTDAQSCYVLADRDKTIRPTWTCLATPGATCPSSSGSEARPRRRRSG